MPPAQEVDLFMQFYFCAEAALCSSIYDDAAVVRAPGMENWYA